MCCLQVTGGTSVQRSSAHYHNTGIYALPNKTAVDNKDQKVHMYVSTIKYICTCIGTYTHSCECIRSTMHTQHT